MVSSKGKLTSLQKDFPEAWFRNTTGFFLTGGAVIVGFLGAPRITRDLNLFTTKQEAFEDAVHLFGSICQDNGQNLYLSGSFRKNNILLQNPHQFILHPLSA